jgi:hypothetical protein
MNDSEHAEAIHGIANLLAGAYLRLRFPEPSRQQLDCADAESDSCDSRLTL